MHVLILHNAKLAYVPVPYMVTPPHRRRRIVVGRFLRETVI